MKSIRNSMILLVVLLTLHSKFVLPVAAIAQEAKANNLGGAIASRFSFSEEPDRLRITLNDRPIVDYVFRDPKIWRPYFANARLVTGTQATRNHPPIKAVDAVDHDTMHPGIWLGFGDINGHDYWRNKAAIEHLTFSRKPTVVDGRLQFATECQLKTNGGDPLCKLTNDYILIARPTGWMLTWSATFNADRQAIVFGDQEEMGLGVRVATPITEKSGGVIRSSNGKTSAKETWGQAAKWCDYSGVRDDLPGIMLMASSQNFRESWWHNRDYGVFVANPFGREAMKQGARSAITVKPGERFTITFGALVHDHQKLNDANEFAEFESLTRKAP